MQIFKILVQGSKNHTEKGPEKNSSLKLNLDWKRAWRYAFWDYQMQNFLRQGAASLQHKKSYTLIHFDPKKSLKFGIFSYNHRRFFLQLPKSYTLTNLNYLKRHWTSITSSPNFYRFQVHCSQKISIFAKKKKKKKKVGILIPLEVLAWVVTECRVLHSSWFTSEEIWIFLVFSIFQSRLQKIHNTVAYRTLWRWCCSQNISKV